MQIFWQKNITLMLFFLFMPLFMLYPDDFVDVDLVAATLVGGLDFIATKKRRGCDFTPSSYLTKIVGFS